MEKELYSVFAVNICFKPYAVDYKLIGAKSRKDLLEKFDFKPWLTDYIGQSELQFQLESIRHDVNRIREIPGLYTDKPYEILDTYAYYE